jgi:hypothetical protein
VFSSLPKFRFTLVPSLQFNEQFFQGGWFMAQEQQERLEARPEEKHSTQIISLIIGFLLFVMGLSGLLWSGFAGLHLGVPYSTLISVSGALLFYNGYNNNSRDAYICCVAFSLFYGLHALAGWIFGDTGIPHLGHDAVDPLLIRIIPGIHELGKHDHILNTVLAIVLAGGAFDWRRRNKEQKSVMRVIRDFMGDHKHKRPIQH